MLIQKYQKNWIADFNAISKILVEALINLNVSIEHIGSTSVPESAAKPIIDIDVIIDNYQSFSAVKSGLESVGYYHNGNQGIVNREVFKRTKLFNHNILDEILHHLYVCPADSEELRRHILFRDYLIANEDARTQYQTLKYEIAAEAEQDKKIYAELKQIKATEFIGNVTDKAEKEHQIMENFEHIFYLDCPHFTVGRVDQWGETGYLRFENKVYCYDEDRKNQCGTTHSPMSVKDFLIYADEQQILIPDDFLKKLEEFQNK